MWMMPHMTSLTETTTASRTARGDEGFSLVELLIVILVLGALATIVTFSVRGMTKDSASTVCGTDKLVLATAVEVYMGQNSLSLIPGADSEERMNTLVSAGLLRSGSS